MTWPGSSASRSGSGWSPPKGRRSRPNLQSLADQVLLLLHVHLVGSGRGGGALGAPDVARHAAAGVGSSWAHSSSASTG